MDLLIAQRDTIRLKWSEISDQHNVPPTLFDHQTDTVSLLLSRNNVLCALPTGSGKTLAQLTTVLFSEGTTAMVIPPLITIEKQMTDICDHWDISYINLSSVSNPKDIQLKIETAQPRIIFASIEQISDLEVQRGLMNISLQYVALDEAQVWNSCSDTIE